MSQNNDNEEILLKSARVLYKSGYSDEAKLVLEKLASPQAKTLLAKMGGASKVKNSKNRSILGLGLGYLTVALLAFLLGWNIAPKSLITVPESSVNSSVDPETAATATERRSSFEETQAALFLMQTDSAMIIDATNAAVRTANPLGATQAAAETKLAATATASR